MIQRISELDQYYSLSGTSEHRNVPSFQADYLSVNGNKLEINTKYWPALSSCILFEVSRAPHDSNGEIIQDNKAVSYYKSYRVGADLIDLMVTVGIRRYFIENDFDLGEKGSGEDCPYESQGEVHGRYPDNNKDRTIHAYAKMQFHAPLTIHNKASFHDDINVYGNSKFYKDIDGTCLRARWADLAETYRSDADYPPGTLVEFGGEEEITEAMFQANAVVTSKPGFVLNSEMKSSDDSCKVLGIALTGRTPVRVVGPVKKFDRLCVSDTPGVACKKENMPLRNTIGIALESNDDPGEKLVMTTVQLNLG